MRVLIIAVHKERSLFERKVTGESLLRAFEAHGVSWSFHIPWEPFQGDLKEYDAALCWSYYGGKHNMAFWAKKFEQQCRACGLPVINSIDGYFRDHSYSLARWAAAGIPCARYQIFTDAEDLRLPYPLILRRDGQHRGRNIFLVGSMEEAKRTIEDQWLAYREPSARKKRIRPLDLAIEYIDVKASDGYYHKRRAIVVGDTIIWREAAISKHWIVNEEHLVQNEYTRSINREFIEGGEPDPELVLKAAKALGSDMVALDYSIRPDGRHIFWEGNRHFQMYGNKGLGKDEIHPATGRTYEERQEVDLAVGRAMVKVLNDRVNDYADIDC